MLAVSLLAASEKSITIADYKESQKNDILRISLEQPEKLFAGYEAVEKNIWSHDEFISTYVSYLEKILSNANALKAVVLDNDTPIGYVCFFKLKEQTLQECAKKINQAVTPELEKILLANHHVKRTEEECGTYAKIDAIAVSQAYGRQGYGRALIKHAINHTKREWPEIKTIELHVVATNTNARALYESEGFVQSTNNAMNFAGMILYEKQLQ